MLEPETSFVQFIHSEYRLRRWNRRGWAPGRYMHSECVRCGAYCDCNVDKVVWTWRWTGIVETDLTPVYGWEDNHRLNGCSAR